MPIKPHPNLIWTDAASELRLLITDLHLLWNPIAPPPFMLQEDDESNSVRSKLVISCQLVLYDTSGKPDLYRVFDACHRLEEYHSQHEKFFLTNKSIVSIFNEEFRRTEVGWWANRSSGGWGKNAEGYYLQYAERDAEAPYVEFTDEDECTFHWNQWVNFMFVLYPEAQSVFSENLQIALDQRTKLNSAIFLSFGLELTDKVRKKEIARRCSKFLTKYAQHELIPSIYSNLERQKVRSAISQILARNMSHNINSHVSYKATNPNVKRRILELYGRGGK
jgi:hypothetical protein